MLPADSKLNDKPLLSIILPCYNVSKYLKRCLESIFSQNITYGFEVIAVNDASTDDTLEALNNYNKIYRELRVINHPANKKLTGARTTGIKEAAGEFIMNVDPDDYLMPNTLSSLFEDNGSYWDILMTNIIIETDKGLEKRYNYIQTEFDMSDNRDCSEIYRQIVIGSCFAKVIRRSLLEDLHYYRYNYNMGEDRAFNIEVFSRARTVVYDNREMYFYALNKNSLDRGIFNPSTLDWDNCWQHNAMEVLQSISIDNKSRRYCINQIERLSVGLLLKIKQMPQKNELYDKWRYFFENIIELFPLKKYIYKRLLKIKSLRLAAPLYFTTVMQWDPIRERLIKIIGK